jgi:hypothetical protein
MMALRGMETIRQCCGAENISLGSGFIRISAPAPAPAPAPSPDPDNSSYLDIDTLKITFFGLSNRIRIVTIYKNFFSNQDFFSIKFLQVCGR